MAVAFIQQSLEFMATHKDLKYVLMARILLCCVLISGFFTGIACIGLFAIALILLHRFQGPYNGGSDRMGLLILTCLTLIHLLPSDTWQEYVFGYLAMQVILSYFIAGWVKFANPDWRNGQALRDVFDFSLYPVSENLRAWANHPTFLLLLSWVVIGFELLFPLTFINQTTLLIGLAFATFFHLSNHYFFGFNRFVWIWIAAYPSILWLQDRVL